MENINVPIIIVEIKYSETPSALGLAIPIAIVTKIADMIENSTAIPVEIIVNEDKSIDFNSFIELIKTPRTSL